jgi:hypothetical protein
MAAGSGRGRGEPWKLALNLSGTAFVGELLFALIGAWLAAALTFSFGLLSALAAGSLLRRKRASPSRRSAISARSPVRDGRR